MLKRIIWYKDQSENQSNTVKGNGEVGPLTTEGLDMVVWRAVRTSSKI